MEYAKGIKARHEPRQEITTEPDRTFLMDLLHHHYDAQSKIGPGVRSFMLVPNTIGNGIEFQVTRMDLTTANFAPRKCIEKFDPLAHIFEACRGAVSDQIEDFKQASFAAGSSVRCPFHDNVLTPEASHVDHEYPKTFAALVRQWMQTNSLAAGDVSLAGTGPRDNAKMLSDAGQAQSWKEYHRENAELRVVSIKANLSDCKKVATNSNARAARHSAEPDKGSITVHLKTQNRAVCLAVQSFSLFLSGYAV